MLTLLPQSVSCQRLLTPSSLIFMCCLQQGEDQYAADHRSQTGTEYTDASALTLFALGAQMSQGSASMWDQGLAEPVLDKIIKKTQEYFNALAYAEGQFFYSTRDRNCPIVRARIDHALALAYDKLQCER